MPANPKPNSINKDHGDDTVSPEMSIDSACDNNLDVDIKSDEEADLDREDINNNENELIKADTDLPSDPDESPEDDIGRKINQLRLAKGYSQRKLAKLSGLTNTSISSIERQSGYRLPLKYTFISCKPRQTANNGVPDLSA